MLEMKITITAPELAAAINNLAAALDPANTTHPTLTGNVAPTNATNADVKSAIPVAPVNPISTATPTVPTYAPSQVPCAPVNMTPAPSVTPAVPTAPRISSVVPTANTVPAPAPAPTIPTSAPTYSLEMLATAGTSLIESGKMNQLMQLLEKYGVDSLTHLKPESYGAIANDLRALGAQI